MRLPLTRRTRLAIWLVALVLVHLAVFALYQRPDFLLQLANEVWGCF